MSSSVPTFIPRPRGCCVASPVVPYMTAIRPILFSRYKYCLLPPTPHMCELGVPVPEADPGEDLQPSIPSGLSHKVQVHSMCRHDIGVPGRAWNDPTIHSPPHSAPVAKVPRDQSPPQATRRGSCSSLKSRLQFPDLRGMIPLTQSHPL